MLGDFWRPACAVVVDRGVHFPNSLGPPLGEEVMSLEAQCPTPGMGGGEKPSDEVMSSKAQRPMRA
eukprot:scaffold232204_cov30-Tisochrysis_lutea.AAC.4